MLTPEQIEIRQSGLGGSDIGALFGLAYDRKPIDVYREKIGEAEPFEANERTRRGSDLEAMVLGWHHEDVGGLRWDRRGSDLEAMVLGWHHEDVGGLRWDRPTTLRRTDRSWHLLTPDAIRGTRVHGPRPLLEDPTTGALVAWPREALEIKTHGWRAGRGYGDEGSDDVPDHIRLQVAWYMAGLEVNQLDVVALIDTHLLRVFPCHRDLELEGHLLEEAEKFWCKNVLERRPPDPDGSGSFRRYLDSRWSGVVSEDVVELEVEATPAIAELVGWFRTTKDVAARAKEAHERAKQRLQFALGPATRVRDDDNRTVATWRRDSRGKPKYPEIVAELAKRAGLSKPELDELVNSHRAEPIRKLLVKKGTA